MPLQHAVAFRYGTPPTAKFASELADGVAELATIGEARRIRFGADLTGERTRGYSHLLLMEFDDLQALGRYQQHPVHQRFAAWIAAHDVGLLVFDYHLDEQTCIMPEV